MELVRALRIIESLIDERNPDTGERAPRSETVELPDAQQALTVAAEALRGLTSRASAPRSNAGKLWHPSDDDVLVSGYDSGKSVRELANDLQRSPLAVRGRLLKLGKLMEHDDAVELG